MNNHIAEASKKVGRPQIREIFLRNGARIEPDRDDLPDWIYDSAFELLELAAPAVQGEPVGVIRESDVMGIAPYADIWLWLEPGTKLYTAPHLAEQQPAPDVAGLVEDAGPLPFWKPCNPGCDPELNGSRSRLCADLCEAAREALAAHRNQGGGV